MSLTPFPSELLLLNKVSMGCTAASTLTPVMVTVTHFSHSESTTLLEVWGLDDTALTGQVAQEAFG